MNNLAYRTIKKQQQNLKIPDTLKTQSTNYSICLKYQIQPDFVDTYFSPSFIPEPKLYHIKPVSNDEI